MRPITQKRDRRHPGIGDRNTMSKKKKNDQAGNTTPVKKESASKTTGDAIKNQATVPTTVDAEKKEALTKEQAVALAKHEGVIEEHLADFRKIGLALKAILDGRLYRETHTDFDDYCEERWNFSGSHARRLIEAADCMGVLEKEISPTGEKRVLPRNEAQIRALTEAQENPNKWAKAWLKVLKATEGKSITAEKIKEVQAKSGGANSTGKAKSSTAAAKPASDAAVKKLSKIEKMVNDVLEEEAPSVAKLKNALTKIRELLKTKKA